MLCKNCGTEIPDGVKFCTQCGTPAESPQTQTVVCNNCGNPVPDGCAFCTSCGTPLQSEFGLTVPPKKKIKKWPIVAAICAVLVIIIGSVIAVNAKSLGNVFRKTFSKPEDYYRYVEKQALDNVLSAVDGNHASTANAQKASVDLELESGGRSMLKMLSSYIDLSWLEGIGITVEQAYGDEYQTGNAAFTLNGKELLRADVAIDIENALTFVRFPELSDTYLYMDMDSILNQSYSDYSNDFDYGYDDNFDSAFSSGFSGTEFSKLMSELPSVLPDEKETEDFLKRYVDTILEHVSHVEKKNGTLEAEGISEKCTVLSVTLTEKDAIEMAKAVLVQARDDEFIVNLINDFSSLIPSLNTEDFQDMIDNALDSLNEEEPSDETLQMDVYVNNKGEIIGRSLFLNANNEKQELLSYGTAKSGNDFSFKAEIPAADFCITGTGTEDGSVINGKFNLSVQGEQILELEVKDYDTNSADDGFLNGKFTLSTEAVPQLSSFSLELDCTGSKNESRIKATIYNGNSALISAAFKSEPSDYKAGELPDKKDAIDMSDEDEMAEYLKEMDWDKLIDILNDSDIPGEYMDSITDSIEQIQKNLSYLY